MTVASTVYVLTLHLGEAGRGTYSVDVPASVASSGCVSYFFQATTTSGNSRVPAEGSYLTNGVGGCTGNYLAAGAPLPTPTTAPTSPPVVISNAPTRQPSQAPTVGSSLAPSATPTKQPSQAPSKHPSQAPTLATDPYSLTNAPSAAPSTEPVSVPSQVGQNRWESLIKPKFVAWSPMRVCYFIVLTPSITRLLISGSHCTPHLDRHASPHPQPAAGRAVRGQRLQRHD